VVPSVDIKLTLAGFHREVRRGLPLPANSCAVPAAAGGGCTHARCLVPQANSSWADGRQPPPSTCARENSLCDCPPGGRVRYGAAPKWSRWRKMRRGEDAVPCGNDLFGDPHPGVGKQCQCELPATAGPRRERERWVYHSKALTASAPWAPVLGDVAPLTFFWVAPTCVHSSSFAQCASPLVLTASGCALRTATRLSPKRRLGRLHICGTGVLAQGRGLTSTFT
jgi:hypothetical protein